jgi:hypothetical protein
VEPASNGSVFTAKAKLPKVFVVLHAVAIIAHSSIHDKETVMAGDLEIDPNVHIDHPHIPEMAGPLLGLSSKKDTPAVSGTNTADGDGVLGSTSHSGVGVHGTGDAGTGVLGESNAGHGVAGFSKTGFGVWGISDSNEGVHAETKSPGTAAIAGYNLNQGPGIFGKGAPAGRFEGDVEVTGDIRLTNADCAEEFDVLHAAQLEPGTVMVFHSDGILQESQSPYDKRVAGIVSGAGKCKPAIILDKAESDENRKIIALLGKVYCKVDAQYGSIEVGDLLTTSPTAGHAMKAADPQKAFGSVIGKAMCAVREGQTMIPVLVALQ